MTGLSKPDVGEGRDWERIWIGYVVEEQDNRGGMRKKIVDVQDGYALCRMGGLGDGRKSRVRLDRLYTARYTVVSRP